MHFTVTSMQRDEKRHFITTDDLEKLKQRARKQKREENIPYHEALELSAQGAHFANWRQVTEAHQAMQPTENAVRHGVVIAMDLKDAMEHADDEIKLKNGRGRFVADQLLPGFYREPLYQAELEGIDEIDGRPNYENYTEAELREFAEERLQEIVFYRFVGNNPPSDLEDVVSVVTKAAFWGPQFVWVNGKMHNT